MLGLPIAFAVPAVLAALAALPVLYWLLRLTPPPPQRVPLPTLALVRDLDRPQETPAQTPWWLLLLRLVVAALVILAMAGPRYTPGGGVSEGRGPLAVVIDDGWSAAPRWSEARTRAEALLRAAIGDGRPVALRAVSEAPGPLRPAANARVLDRLRGLEPRPLALDRGVHRAALEDFLRQFPEATVAWVGDGTATADDARVVAGLAAAFPGRVVLHAAPWPAARAIVAARQTAEHLALELRRPPVGPTESVSIRASDSRGRPLGEGRATFLAGAGAAEARLPLPLELRNEVARVEIVAPPGEAEEPAPRASAGAVHLLDGRHQRRRVAIVSGETTDTAQPLVSQGYFVARALAPFAEVREGGRRGLTGLERTLEEAPGVIVLLDTGTLAGPALEKLRSFVEEGGVLIRFASRRVANPSDALMPVRLRRNERVLGGALSWDRPQKLGGFPETSPLAGLSVPEDVTVAQQILAEPDAELSARTWAYLQDGTPLITGDRRGQGLVALVHVTADTTWSTLPLSGVFVEVLRRLVALARVRGAEDTVTDVPATREQQMAAPLRVLDGFGAFRPPPATAQPVAMRYAGVATPVHPPGFYGPPDGPLAINLLAPDTTLATVDTTGVDVRPLAASPSLDLKPILLAMALLLFLVDAVATLWLSGALRRFARPRAVAGAVMAATLGALTALGAMSGAVAQGRAPDALPTFRADDVEAALVPRLAYVITGDREIDEISRQGLQGLTRALATRTAFEPGEPMGVDPARDELVFYPLIYWPMAPSALPPSGAAIRAIDRYMRNGGTVIFDTRDALRAGGRPGQATTAETQLLRRILGSLDVPDLEPAPRDHVVTKTFYIVDSFPGRYATGQTWFETLQRDNNEDGRRRPAQAGDRVSPIIITSNDLAAAWAVDRQGQPRFPLVPGDARQREMAIRGGINIVMYAMTGNYKADQVHVPALLERLGQ